MHYSSNGKSELGHFAHEMVNDDHEVVSEHASRPAILPVAVSVKLDQYRRLVRKHDRATTALARIEREFPSAPIGNVFAEIANRTLDDLDRVHTW